jgi:hypothetical protein
VDALVHFVGEPALVAAGLGGVDRGDQGEVEVFFEGDCGVRDQPVVGVDDVEFGGFGGTQGGAGEGVVERHGPGQEGRRGQREGRWVFRGAHDAYPIGIFLQGGTRGVPGDYGDFMPGRNERQRQSMDVPAQAADDDRWVFPRQHQHPLWSGCPHLMDLCDR